jgi:hypothetical protein
MLKEWTTSEHDIEKVQYECVVACIAGFHELARLRRKLLDEKTQQHINNNTTTLTTGQKGDNNDMASMQATDRDNMGRSSKRHRAGVG